MPPPSSVRSAIASVKYHVQQWVNLVLYNSIYQNLFLLHLYRLFKFIYGFFDRSTELSRICGANNWRTPLDSLWDENGNVISSVVDDKHVGTIAYTNVALSQLQSTGGNGVTIAAGRHGSMQAGPAATAAATAIAERNSIDSPQSTRSSQDSGSDTLERRTNPQGSTSVVEEGQEPSGLKRRKRGGSSLSSTSTNSLGTHIHMDLRQSRSAAGMIYRIGNKNTDILTFWLLERRELELPDNDTVQITHQILRKKRFPDGGSSETPAAKKLQYALDKIASSHQLAREINQRVHTKYDSTNPAHERKLMLLWELLCPQEKLDGRYTKKWTEIGFQGKDPATDFRGMGYLFHRFNDYWTTLEPKPSIMDFERVFGDFKIMMERQLARRKLMMLRSDTKENLGMTHQQQRGQQTPEGEGIELEDKKSK
ncbi:ELMO domain-containing protein 1 [Entomortierella chlamydospora]|nr:ELMO domain-containing protein 1 [Entomortierella chlamydospora]